MAIRIKFNNAGFRELRTSAETKALVKSHADQIGERANATPSTTQPAATEPYYKVFDATDHDRARYRVATATARAKAHEARTQALQKAL